MFPRDSGTELEAGYLRSGGRFRLGKRRKTVIGIGSCSTTKGEDYKIALQMDKGSCHKKEE